jgi:zinc transport system permease protein
MLELLQYDFFVNAVIAAVLTSITCGIIGTYIVSKRIVFISGGITHTSFGGIGLGYYLGFNPLLGATVFSLLAAWIIEFMSKRTDVREDSAIAILWSFGMAIGIIFIFITPGYAPNLMSYLFGSILTVSHLDIIMMLTVTLSISLFFGLFYKTILYTAFDEQYLKTRNIPVEFFNYILIGFVALAIVLSIKTVGIILIISLLTIPQSTANLFVKDFGRIILYSVIIGIAGSLSGLTASYYLNIPSGASIIFFLVVIFAVLRFIKYLSVKTIRVDISDK